MKTIIEIAELYIFEKDLAPKTKSNYLIIARLCVKDSSCKYFEYLDAKTIVRWRKNVFKRNAAATTWNTYLRHMKILSNFAVRKNIVTKRTNLGEFYSAVFQEKPKVVSTKQIKEALRVTEAGRSGSHPNWFWCIVLRTYYYTAMRRRQLVGLMWKDINFYRGTIRLAATHSKTKREWTIPAADPVKRDLEELYKRSLEFYNDKQLENMQVFNLPLFNPKHKTDGLTVEAISRYFARLSNQVGFGISAHRLRHTAATQLARSKQYNELSNLLGHTRFSTTMKYVHPDMKEIRSMVDTLDNID